MKSIIIILVALLSFGCKAQNSLVKEVENSQLNNFTGRLVSYKSYDLKDNFIRVFITANDSGSAHNDGTGEVSQNIFISNCNDGETLDCKLYLDENMINIIVEKVYEDNKTIYIDISFGNFDKRKVKKIVIVKT